HGFRAIELMTRENTLNDCARLWRRRYQNCGHGTLRWSHRTMVSASVFERSSNEPHQPAFLLARVTPQHSPKTGATQSACRRKAEQLARRVPQNLAPVGRVGKERPRELKQRAVVHVHGRTKIGPVGRPQAVLQCERID